MISPLIKHMVKFLWCSLVVHGEKVCCLSDKEGCHVLIACYARYAARMSCLDVMLDNIS